MIPPKTACFDIETNGLLLEATTIHCIAIYDMNTNTNTLYGGSDEVVQQGLKALTKYNVLVGHNISKFDIPVIHKLFPAYTERLPIDATHIRDTLLMSQMLCPDIDGGHSLDSWGKRVGEFKGNYSNGWGEYSDEMGEYCLQDTVVGVAIFKALVAILKQENLTETFWNVAYRTEMDIVPILTRQYVRGIDFDVEKAKTLTEKLLADQLALDNAVIEMFPPLVIPGPEVVAPQNRGFLTKGVSYCKVEFQTFNPGSRQQIYTRLNKKYGWVAKSYTDKGSPIIDQTVLADIPYPEAQLLYNRLELGKRIGQLQDGKAGWIKLVDNDGRIHGDFQQCGTVTRRFTHMRPNMSQVPACGKPYGEECRALFHAPVGYKQVGIDAAALEMRLLAGYIKRYDQGSFEFDVLKGDAHQTNADILGCKRSEAKGWFYAFVYGAGEEKLQKLVPGSRKQVFEEGLPGFKALKTTLLETLNRRGYLISLDGCPLRIRHRHVALNTLLQSAGSIIMKKALKIFDDALQDRRLQPGRDYEFVNNVHDEWQLVVKDRDNLPELVGQIGVESIRKAGEFFKFPTPMDGEAKVGQNWAETH